MSQMEVQKFGMNHLKLHFEFDELPTRTLLMLLELGHRMKKQQLPGNTP